MVNKKRKWWQEEEAKTLLNWEDSVSVIILTEVKTRQLHGALQSERWTAEGFHQQFNDYTTNVLPILFKTDKKIKIIAIVMILYCIYF